MKHPLWQLFQHRIFCYKVVCNDLLSKERHYIVWNMLVDGFRSHILCNVADFHVHVEIMCVS